MWLRTLYVLFAIELGSRRAHVFGATTTPDSAWVTQQARNLAVGKQLPDIRFLIRDRDTKFSGPFDEVFRTEDVRIIKTPIRAPRANAFAERWVRTARQECLDHILIFGRRHLGWVKGTETVDRRLDQRVRRMGPFLLVGGSVLVLRSRVPVAAPRAAVDRWLLQRTDERRSRGSGPSSPVDGPQAPGGQAAPSPSRPAIPGRVEQDSASSRVVVVCGQLPDAPSLAPRPGAKEVDLPGEVRRRQAADPGGGSRPHPADGEGEPPVGVHQDPG